MFTGFTSPTARLKQARKKDTTPSSAINRLLIAAVVNKNFRDLLLTDPGQALIQGYQGELFPLDYDERILILSIQADTLRDFALQIISFQEDNCPDFSETWIPVNHSTVVLDA